MKKSLKIVIIALSSIAICLLFLVLFYNISKSRTFQLFGGLVGKVNTQEKVIALTFDDGPGIYTEEIIQVLKEEKVKATFFLTGKEIEENIEAAIKLVEEGHEIGNHTYSHQRMVLKKPSFIKSEIETTDKLIRQIGYQGEIHFRPPNGKRLFILPYYLSKNNRKTILWNIEPKTADNNAGSAEKIVAHVKRNASPGSIILLHVMYESRIESLNSVRGIIESLQEQDYKFVTISELMKYK